MYTKTYTCKHNENTKIVVREDQTYTIHYSMGNELAQRWCFNGDNLHLGDIDNSICDVNPVDLYEYRGTILEDIYHSCLAFRKELAERELLGQS